eukprot:GHVR01118678.1.p1 GENE.GHVR01118678.1~~GHVR01118678.1.p1  ORF type:complete len:182 (-),score=49.65 GHVR01118678.1:38-583(-)
MDPTQLIVCIGVPTLVVYIIIVVTGIIWCRRRRKELVQKAPRSHNLISFPDVPKSKCPNNTKNESDVESQSTVIMPSQDKIDTKELLNAPPPKVIRDQDHSASVETSPLAPVLQLKLLRQELKELYRVRQESIAISSNGYVFRNINISPAIRLKKAITVHIEKQQQNNNNNNSFFSYIGIN